MPKQKSLAVVATQTQTVLRHAAAHLWGGDVDAAIRALESSLAYLREFSARRAEKAAGGQQ